jgi:23S rRNA (guanine745-N1)-methyltransferase
MKFVCPKCGLPLTVTDGGTAKCENNHSYDKARAGYYNLLLGNTAGTHGDNREMLDARRIFLDTGAYRPLADAVSDVCVKYASGGDILDVGCGEGYYTDIIEKKSRAFVSAFDISREAVKLAHRRNPNVSLAVASAYKVPVRDASFDLVLNMFSPLSTDEIYRALRKGGIFVMAIPGEEHLFGLKAATYNTPYKNEVHSKELTGFELVSDTRVRYSMRLTSNEDIRALFMMTPYAYRTGREERERVLSLKELETEADFYVLVYRKR